MQTGKCTFACQQYWCLSYSERQVQYLSHSHSPSMFACLLFKLYNLYLDKTFLSDKSMVLKHHPDKRKARGLKVGDGEDDYFTCITRGNDGAGFDFSIVHLK